MANGGPRNSETCNNNNKSMKDYYSRDNSHSLQTIVAANKRFVNLHESSMGGGESIERGDKM